MGLIRAPIPDPSVESFRGGVGVLTRDGQVAGHVATTLGEFWSPGSPLRRQWWVWLIVDWVDGTRERPTEDYPPWTYVAEMKQGVFEWAGGGAYDGRYDFAWLSPDKAQSMRDQLDIKPEDF